MPEIIGRAGTGVAYQDGSAAGRRALKTFLEICDLFGAANPHLTMKGDLHERSSKPAASSRDLLTSEKPPPSQT